MRWAVLLLALSAVGVADEPTDVALPHRTSLAVQLDTPLKTNHVHAGDAVGATLVTPVLLHGVVVIPKAAKLHGHVLVVQPHSAGGTSRLIVRFEEAQWAQQSVKINAFIVHQVIEKTVVAWEVDEGCAPRGSAPVAVPRPSRGSLTPWTGCPDGTVSGKSEETRVLSTPVMKDITVRRSKNPAHMIELISAKKDIDLHRGMLLELRHLEPRPPK